jgi:SAM-dependent methyltransferase
MAALSSKNGLGLFDRSWKKLRRWEHYPYVTYEIIAFFFRNKSDWRFMNYGFSPLDASEPVLDAADEEERLSVQLYHFVGSGAQLADKHILEVGSGRGGGASFVQRYFKPRSTTGIDFSPRVVGFCLRNYRDPGLRFEVGNAMNLRFSSGSFDAVLNVESSHLYPDRNQFYREAFRVLRPGGAFLYCDVLPEHLFPSVQEGLESAGFTVQHEQTINPEVLRALDLDHERRLDIILRHVPKLFRSFAGMFAVVRGSYPHRKLESGKSRFFRFVAVKPE